MAAQAGARSIQPSSCRTISDVEQILGLCCRVQAGTGVVLTCPQRQGSPAPRRADGVATLLLPGMQQLSRSVHEQRLQLPFGKGMLNTQQTRDVLMALSKDTEVPPAGNTAVS